MDLGYVREDSLIEVHEERIAKRRRCRYFSVACIVFLSFSIILICILVFNNYFRSSSNNGSSQSMTTFEASITLSSLLMHTTAFYDIAISDPILQNSRSVLNAYNESVGYIQEYLLQYASPLNVSLFPFLVPIWQEFSSPSLNLIINDSISFDFLWQTDFQSLRDGGNGYYNFTASFISINAFGCDLTNFDNIRDKDAIAIIAEGGGCSYYDKALNAQNAGAKAGIIYRTSNSITTLSTSRVRKSPWYEGDPLIMIPFFTSSYLVGQMLNYYSNFSSSKIVWTCNISYVVAQTMNLIAETTQGDPQHVVVVGAHLDSVVAGPGINDNGSGASTILQLAVQFNRLFGKPRNQVRFMWFGAEELGLIGSYAYMNSLTTEEKNNIYCMLNFDMMASPNGVRQVMNVNSMGVPETIKNRTRVVTKLFSDYFSVRSLSWVDENMGGGSDYYPFLLQGIAVGTIGTGSSELKTESQQNSIGGIMNAWLDPCYHQACDAKNNLNQSLFLEMSRSAAYVLQQISLGQPMW